MVLAPYGRMSHEHFTLTDHRNPLVRRPFPAHTAPLLRDCCFFAAGRTRAGAERRLPIGPSAERRLKPLRLRPPETGGFKPRSCDSATPTSTCRLRARPTSAPGAQEVEVGLLGEVLECLMHHIIFHRAMAGKPVPLAPPPHADGGYTCFDYVCSALLCR